GLQGRPAGRPPHFSFSAVARPYRLWRISFSLGGRGFSPGITALEPMGFRAFCVRRFLAEAPEERLPQILPQPLQPHPNMRFRAPPFSSLPHVPDSYRPAASHLAVPAPNRILWLLGWGTPCRPIHEHR